MRCRIACLLASALIAIAAPVGAQEVFAGAYAHEVETPFTFPVDEGGVDIELGYRFAPQEALDFLGKPQPYVLASLNSQGDTSFAGAGLSWKLGDGPVFVRPGIGVVVHDGPDLKFDPVTFQRYDLGSRVLFEPEIAVGTQVSDRLAVEASWVHISQGRLFNWKQNPGIDMMGVRLTYRIR